MSGIATKTMLAAYIQNACIPTGFFTGMFQVRPGNVYDGEEVEIDIQRSGEDIAIVVYDISTGYRMNADDLYTNKSFKPPVFKEAFTINAFSLIKRQAGQNPFTNPVFRANLTNAFFRGMVKVDEKIRRAIELQAAQVLQTGKLSLINELGAVAYELDYKPKVTHFPTASVAWNAAGSTKLADLEALCDVIRNDGQVRPDQIIFGAGAFRKFLADEEVYKLFESRRIDRGQISPVPNRGQDAAQYRGVINIGAYHLDVWTYGATYKDPQTGAVTEYMDPAKVVVRASGARMDATFGNIPNIGELLGVGPRAQMIPELPARMTGIAEGVDFHTNVWLDERGEALFGGVGSRPLMIPTAIDTFACLDTGL